MARDNKKNLVGFVGDGLNDCAALASAHVGIVLQEVESQATVDAASAVLQGELSQLPLAILLARRAMNLVKANVVLALAFNGAVVLCAATVGLPLWASVAADNAGLLLGNSLWPPAGRSRRRARAGEVAAARAQSPSSSAGKPPTPTSAAADAVEVLPGGGPPAAAPALALPPRRRRHRHFRRHLPLRQICSRRRIRRRPQSHTIAINVAAVARRLRRPQSGLGDIQLAPRPPGLAEPLTPQPSTRTTMKEKRPNPPTTSPPRRPARAAHQGTCAAGCCRRTGSCSRRCWRQELPFRLSSNTAPSLLHADDLLERFVGDAAYRAAEPRTCAEDAPLVAHFCGNDASTLLAAAKLAEPHAVAVDLNLGCPQRVAHWATSSYPSARRIIRCCSASCARSPRTCACSSLQDSAARHA